MVVKVNNSKLTSEYKMKNGSMAFQKVGMTMISKGHKE